MANKVIPNPRETRQSRASVPQSTVLHPTKLALEHEGMDLDHGIVLDDQALEAFCSERRVKRLALFGSVLGDRFESGSDLDVLVEFENGHTPGMLTMAAMELELEELVGLPVDLRTYGDLSRHFRDQVVAEARPIYAASHLVDAATTARQHQIDDDVSRQKRTRLALIASGSDAVITRPDQLGSRADPASWVCTVGVCRGCRCTSQTSSMTR